MAHLVQVIKTNGTNNKFVDNKTSRRFFYSQSFDVYFFTDFKCDLLVFSLKMNLAFFVFLIFYFLFTLNGFSCDHSFEV